MERIEVNTLIIGENLYSLYLTSLLKYDDDSTLILAPNKAAMLILPYFRYNDSHSHIYKERFSDEIGEFLRKNLISFNNDLSPLSVLHQSGRIINCSAVPDTLNYYQHANAENSRITFIDIDNLSGSAETDIAGYETIRIRVLNENNMYSVFRYAEMLDSDEEVLRDLIRRLTDIKSMGNKIIVLPPVLGIRNYDKIRNHITDATKKKIFEIFSVTTSVISRRFYLFMQKGFENNQGKILYDRALSFECQNDIIKCLRTRSAEIYPKRVVLIQERFAEEGLTIEGNSVIESIFGLPVFFEDGRNEISYFTREGIFERHNIFSCGVRTDDEFCPLDIYGERIFRNLYVTGSIVLNKNDPMLNLCETERLYSILTRR